MNEKVKNEVNGENIEILDSGSTTESKGSKIKIVIPINSFTFDVWRSVSLY